LLKRETEVQTMKMTEERLEAAQNKQVWFRDLGHVAFQESWDLQHELLKETVDRKLSNRSLPFEEKLPTENHLLFCAHPHVYTLGKSGKEEHLLVNEKERKEKGIEYYKINRGGDITYHGPGQVVGYPIIDLDNFFTDIHKFLRLLEEVVIRTLAIYGVKGDRLPGATGVWLDPADPARARKICAIGIRCGRWVTMHGWAFNVNSDLSYFDLIVPCGLHDKSVTSLEKELGRKVDIEEVKQYLKLFFSLEFGAAIVERNK